MQEEGPMKGLFKLTLISCMLFATVLLGREKAEIQADAIAELFGMNKTIH